MGNNGSVQLDAEDWCVGSCGRRSSPPFIPPNSQNATYTFAASKQATFPFLKLNGDSTKFSAVESPIVSRDHLQGFLLESQAPSMPPVSYTVRKYKLKEKPLRAVVSGRVLTQVWGSWQPMSYSDRRSGGACAFAVCTRGLPVVETLQTGNFTHFGQVVTSGVFFALFISVSANSLCLCPQIYLVLRSGERVVLVDDRIGPIKTPQSFYTDFTVVDDSRNIQVDMIFRGEGPGSDRTMRTLRSCLQEYTAFNSHLDVVYISIGHSNIQGVSHESSAHLQDLVISEEVAQASSSSLSPHNILDVEQQRAYIVYEGSRARARLDHFRLPRGHPQMQRVTLEQLTNQKVVSNRMGRPGKQEEVWHNVRYDTEIEEEESAYSHVHLHGEIWMSSSALSERQVYFQCSSNMAQALTLCTIFRFNCPYEYLRLITESSSSSLTRMHIPTNGIVLGVERDPRHSSLLRMFIEHRNEIKEDMVVCECNDMLSTTVFQEIYDGGEWIAYRVIVIFPDGHRQSAVLGAHTENWEDPSDESVQTDLDQRNSKCEDPSVRFPIIPSNSGHKMSPNSRVLLYSSAAHDMRPTSGLRDETLGSSDGHSARGQTPSLVDSLADSAVTVASEDWHSVTDEVAPVPYNERLPIWPQPLVDNCILATNVEAPPFHWIG